MTNTRLLQGKMTEKAFTIKALSEKIGVSSTCLFNKMHNLNEFYASEIMKIQQALYLTDEDVRDIFFVKRVEYESTKEGAL